MRKFLYTTLVAVALTQNACAVTLQQSYGATQKYLTIQQKTFVKMRNNCAPFIRIEGVVGTYAEKVPLGQPFTVVLVRQPGESDQGLITVTGFDKDGTYFGSNERTFQFYLGQDRIESWTVDYLKSPNSGGGCPR
ncbi:MAG: hypothetical protein WAV25_01145 [Minisyncoccia bacterium]